MKDAPERDARFDDRLSSPRADYRLSIREWLAGVDFDDRLLPLCFLVTGAALVIHIVTPLPLWFTTPVTVVTGGLILWGLYRRGDADGERTAALIVIGLRSGIVALITYDLARLGWVWATGASVNPFDALPLFGAGLVGETAPVWGRWTAGVLFHVANGLGFAIAFVLLFRERANVWWGVAWGLALEVLVLALYPAWLQLDAIRKFATMSVFGHVIYGGTLGATAKRQWDRLAEQPPKRLPSVGG